MVRETEEMQTENQGYVCENEAILFENVSFSSSRRGCGWAQGGAAILKRGNYTFLLVNTGRCGNLSFSVT